MIAMKGNELPIWRQKNGYWSQQMLQMELGIKSRATISAWENSSEPLPRLTVLALKALELDRSLRNVVQSTKG